MGRALLLAALGLRAANLAIRVTPARLDVGACKRWRFVRGSPLVRGCGRRAPRRDSLTQRLTQRSTKAPPPPARPSCSAAFSSAADVLRLPLRRAPRGALRISGDGHRLVPRPPTHPPVRTGALALQAAVCAPVLLVPTHRHAAHVWGPSHPCSRPAKPPTQAGMRHRARAVLQTACASKGSGMRRGHGAKPGHEANPNQGRGAKPPNAAARVTVPGGVLL
jgi:hypothetical protein